MNSRPQTLSHPQSWFAALAVVTLLLVLLLNGLTTAPALEQLMDFGSFIAAGREAAQGNNPYTTDSPLVYRLDSQTSGRSIPSPNLNLPISLHLFAPLASMDPLRAANGWRLASAILYTAGILLLSAAYPRAVSLPRILWAASLAGFWHTLAVGQIYIILLLPCIAVWILAERGYRIPAGIALGLIVALRPNFVLWLGLLAVTGNLIVSLWAVATGLTLSLLPLVRYGPVIYEQWFSALSGYPEIGLLIAGNSSFASLAARFGLAWAGILLSVLFAAIVFFLTRTRSGLPLRSIHTLGIVGALLISPFSWVGYTLLTLPIFLTREQWSWRLVFAAALLAFPYLLVLMFFQVSPLSSIVFGWIYGWGLLLILFDLTESAQAVPQPV